MSHQETLETALVEAACAFDALSQKQRWHYEQAWREVYARGTYARTGRWRIPDFEWHVFSCGDSPSKSGARAIELYAAESPATFIVWPEDQTTAMFLCHGGKPPSFIDTGLDIHVFPPELSWTMAFTHELSLGLGPYFSRREWQH